MEYDPIDADGQRGASPAPARPSLAALERLLTTNDDPLPQLHKLGDPWELHLSLYLQLCLAVKVGPASAREGGVTPRRLLSLAQRAAEQGIVPCATPDAMRQALARAEAGVRAAGAWQAGTPLWWHPLPPPTPLERAWSAWSASPDGPLSLPSDSQLHATFAAGNPPLWMPLQAVFETALARQLYEELAAGYAAAEIELEPGGVGASGALSSSRADWVGYQAGTEPALLAAAPTFAAFVQGCLSYLGERLADALPGRRLSAPPRVMLARYPAPSRGYAPHLDNVGGEQDNGRALTIVLYLNPPERAPVGGELALWAPGVSFEAPPTATLAPVGGSGVLLHAREIVHQVRPVREGPARWAIVIWLNDAREPSPRPALPTLSPTDVLLPVAAPPLDEGVVLTHRLDDPTVTGRISVERPEATDASLGIVSTVYRGGPNLDRWCAFHFSLGVEHIALVFDHLDQPQEASDAARLRAAYPPTRLTIWSGRELMEGGWHGLAREDDLAELAGLAATGSSSAAVSARQALNATAALRAAQSGELGDTSLDWLLHLDNDELFYLHGPTRGGATLAEHLSVAGAAGLRLIRYVNHELLLPHAPGAPPRFKLNPTVAATRLGPVGWSEMVRVLKMSQSDPRPYFSAYLNGKSAVWVQAGVSAAGVHSWALAEPFTATQSAFLAGPSILHFHFASRKAFRDKYLHIAAGALPREKRPFAPSPAEVAAVDLIRSLQDAGADDATIARRLDALHSRLASFSEIAVELLQDAGLLLAVDLEHPLTIEQ